MWESFSKKDKNRKETKKVRKPDFSYMEEILSHYPYGYSEEEILTARYGDGDSVEKENFKDEMHAYQEYKFNRDPQNRIWLAPLRTPKEKPTVAESPEERLLSKFKAFMNEEMVLRERYELVRLGHPQSNKKSYIVGILAHKIAKEYLEKTKQDLNRKNIKKIVQDLKSYYYNQKRNN